MVEVEGLYNFDYPQWFKNEIQNNVSEEVYDEAFRKLLNDLKDGIFPFAYPEERIKGKLQADSLEPPKASDGIEKFNWSSAKTNFG